MKEINLPSGNYLFVEVPNDATNFKIVFEDSIKYYSENNSLADGNDGIACYVRYRFFDESKNEDIIISTTKDITEEQAESIVFHHVVSGTKYYSNYMPYKSQDFRDVIDNSFSTAKESLQSLIRANKLDVNKNYLILKKL